MYDANVFAVELVVLVLNWDSWALPSSRDPGLKYLIGFLCWSLLYLDLDSSVWSQLWYLTGKTHTCFSSFSAGWPGVVTGGWAVPSQHRVLVLWRGCCLCHRLRPGKNHKRSFCVTLRVGSYRSVLSSLSTFHPFKECWLYTNSGTFPVPVAVLGPGACCTSCLPQSAFS